MRAGQAGRQAVNTNDLGRIIDSLPLFHCLLLRPACLPARSRFRWICPVVQPVPSNLNHYHYRLFFLITHLCSSGRSNRREGGKIAMPLGELLSLFLGRPGYRQIDHPGGGVRVMTYWEAGRGWGKSQASEEWFSRHAWEGTLIFEW